MKNLWGFRGSPPRARPRSIARIQFFSEVNRNCASSSARTRPTSLAYCSIELDGCWITRFATMASCALLVHFLTTSSLYDRFDHPMLHASFRRCCVSCDKRVDKLHTWPTVSSCMSGCALQFLSWPSNADAIRYFYHPNNMSRFRLPGCNSSSRHARGTGSYRGDLIWEPYPNQLCLWSNMAFGKLLANILFMRAFDVTHLIESGRMGGLSLVGLPAPNCTQPARYLP